MFALNVVLFVNAHMMTSTIVTPWTRLPMSTMIFAMRWCPTLKFFLVKRFSIHMVKGFPMQNYWCNTASSSTPMTTMWCTWAKLKLSVCLPLSAMNLSFLPLLVIGESLRSKSHSQLQISSLTKARPEQKAPFTLIAMEKYQSNYGCLSSRLYGRIHLLSGPYPRVSWFTWLQLNPTWKIYYMDPDHPVWTRTPMDRMHRHHRGSRLSWNWLERSFDCVKTRKRPLDIHGSKIRTLGRFWMSVVCTLSWWWFWLIMFSWYFQTIPEDEGRLRLAVFTAMSERSLLDSCRFGWIDFIEVSTLADGEGMMIG